MIEREYWSTVYYDWIMALMEHALDPNVSVLARDERSVLSQTFGNIPKYAILRTDEDLVRIRVCLTDIDIGMIGFLMNYYRIGAFGSWHVPSTTKYSDAIVEKDKQYWAEKARFKANIKEKIRQYVDECNITGVKIIKAQFARDNGYSISIVRSLWNEALAET